jgi:hypothetical protein
MKRDFNTDWNIKKLDEAVAGLKAHIASLERMVTERNGEVLPLQQYPRAPSFTLTNTGWTGYEATPNRARKLVADWFAECEPIRAANAAAVENNKKIYEQVESYLLSLGFPASETPTNYGRRGKVTHDAEIAGWLRSLDRHVRTVDGWALVEKTHRELTERIDRFEAEQKEKRERAEREEAQKEAARVKAQAGAIALASVILRRGWPEDITAEDALEKLLASNKYLRLAHYMQLNRGDWNDGPSYAEEGLRTFTIENEQDREIYDEVWCHVSDWDGDGRVFRDCQHNYDWLFAKVRAEDPALLEDYSRMRDLQPGYPC